MSQHPCPLRKTNSRTNASCLFCGKRACPGQHCGSCKVYFCSKCHETLQREQVPGWRQELSLQRDEYLKDFCVRQRKESIALVPCISISDLRSIIVSYSIELPTVVIIAIQGIVLRFGFGEHARPSLWIQLSEPDIRSKFKTVIKQISLGKIDVQN